MMVTIAIAEPYWKRSEVMIVISNKYEKETE